MPIFDPLRSLALRLRPVAAGLAVLVLAACDLTTPDEPIVEETPNPLAGRSLYVDGSSLAARQVQEWATSRPGDAQLIARIAQQPQAIWLGAWFSDVGTTVRSLMADARSRGGMPVFVVYNIPRLDCVATAGAGTGAEYREWIDRIAGALGGDPSVVILEPDALGLLADCLDAGGQDERLQLLADAVDRLSGAGATVYIDAGTAGWIPAPTMAERLLDAGVAKARGFAVNVSNFQTTAASDRYARLIADRIGPVGWVIDTSRNGNGSNGEWCNPEGRALGEPPSIDGSTGGLDALLWVKRPGESDGTCNGGPPAGMWWPEYALGLAARAEWT